MKKIEEYIKEEMKGCPFTQEQEDKLLIGLTKFLDDLEQKQLRIGSVIHWVAVKDSLPDTDEYVLVKCNNNMSEYFTNRYYLHLKTWDYYKPKDITHWAKIESPCA